MEQLIGSRSRKEDNRAACCHLACSTFMLRNAGLGELQCGFEIGRRNINNLRYVDDTILIAESEEELKSFLMRGKEESERARFKLKIKKTKVMASWPHYYMANRRGKGGSSDRFPLLGLQNHWRW